MTEEEKDRINRAEEIQQYTENRCENLEKENEELKSHRDRLINLNHKLTKEKEKQKAQIEKMKCCGNCKHAVCSDGIVIDCYKEPRCVNGDQWELEE